MKNIIFESNYTIKLFDKDKLLFSKTYPSNSWTNNYYYYIYCLATNTPPIVTDTTRLRNTSGTYVSSIPNNSYSPTTVEFWNNSSIGGDVGGAVIGTGTGAETLTDNTLTLINNGTTSGKMSWGAISHTTDGSLAPTYTSAISRLFTNSSGGTITVGECGLYGNFVGTLYLFNRDLLPSTIDVLNSQTFYLEYDLSITLPG